MARNVVQGPMRFVQIVPTDYAVVGGVLGWIDTDCSASVPSGAIAVVYKVYAAANQNAGARPPGAATDTKYNCVAITWEENTTGQVGGHIELYRAAANNTYKIMGYWI